MGHPMRPSASCVAAERNGHMPARAFAVSLAAATVVAAALPLSAGAQDPTFICGTRAATTVGTPGDDVIYGTAGNDIIAGLGGDDVIYGLGGNDRICGDVNGLEIGGNDFIDAGPGDDRVLGEGADIAIAGSDTIYGGPGNEVFL